MAGPLIGVAAAIAASLAVPVGKLTLKMIRNARIPVRYKKLLQGQTKGEKQIAGAVKSNRETAVQEVKTVGALVGGGTIAKLIYDASKKADASEKPKSTKKKVSAGSRSKTNQATKTKTDKVLEKELQPEKRPIVLIKGEPPRRPSGISKLKRGGMARKKK